MMEAFARDPEKVNRFRELTRWRKMRDEELRKGPRKNNFSVKV